MTAFDYCRSLDAVQIRRRSFLGRLRRAPAVGRRFWQFYRADGLPRRVWGTWQMLWLLLRPERPTGASLSHVEEAAINLALFLRANIKPSHLPAAAADDWPVQIIVSGAPELSERLREILASLERSIKDRGYMA